MKCPKCKLQLSTEDSRSFITVDGVPFTRRIRKCAKKHKIITHEINAKDSPIPDVYRLKRKRKTKSKTKKTQKQNWLKKIEEKLNEL
jgi:hypothetical protein